MKMRHGAIVVVSALVLAAGCGDSSGPAMRLDLRVPWVPDSTAVLGHSGYSGFGGATRAVVADSQTWAATWVQFIGSLRPRPPLPAVDFTKDRVLVVALGSRPTGGFDIRIDSVAFRGGAVVYVTTVAPGPLCYTTQAITSPVELVRLPQPPEPIAFQDRSVVTDCQ